jgi:hypothetical protein
LDNVEHDKAAMTRVLERGGFQVFTSFNRTRAQLLADEAQFLAQARGSDPRSVIVYMSGHGIGMDGRNYFVPADAPPSPQVGVGDLLDIAEIQQKLALAIRPGTFAILLVDACRSTAAGKAQALFASRDLGIPVNYSTAPGNRSYDSEEGMSAWTKRFVSVADSFPWLGIDQVIMYANRYTKWQSATTQQQQTPVLYGRLSTAVPPLGTQAAPRSYAVATLTQEMQ